MPLFYHKLAENRFKEVRNAIIYRFRISPNSPKIQHSMLHIKLCHHAIVYVPFCGETIIKH